MKKTILSLFGIMVCAMMVIAQTPEEMKAWQEYMTPSEPHKVLEKQNGLWHAHTLMWTDPEADPMKSEGVMENKMIMGGRYQESNFTANMMGMPFEGKSITAYDNATHMMSTIWLDNMGTGMMYLEGKFDMENNTILMQGTMTDPMTGKSLPVREVLYLKSDTHQMFEMYITHDGKEMKSMEIHYKKFSPEEEKEYEKKMQVK